MRELKQEDPSELELDLELDLEADDVDAAVAAVAAASEGQIPCSCCDELLDDAEQLHNHQIVQHSLSELSLALITLRGLDLPFGNGSFEVGVDEDSSHLRNIMLESVDRTHDCDSESTVTVNSEARMATISPPSSPIFVAAVHSAKTVRWTNDVSPSEHSLNLYIGDDNQNQNQEQLDSSHDSEFWSENTKSILEKPIVLGPRKPTKKYNDLDSRQFFCHLCDRRYKKKSHLERHFRVHTGVRPYECHICDKRFAVRSILKQHIRVHTGERPFSCNICFQRFPQKSGLMTHMMLHNGKPFKCEYCVKSFVSNHKLMLHQRSHGDLVNGAPHQGPYCCSSCNMRFFTTGALSEHAKVHMLENHQVTFNRNCFNEEETISEEAARAAVSAFGSFPDDLPDYNDVLHAYQDDPLDLGTESPEYHDELFDFGTESPEYQDEALEFQIESPAYQHNLLDIVKNEIFEEDDMNTGSYLCEARWSGIEDMCI